MLDTTRSLENTNLITDEEVIDNIIHEALATATGTVIGTLGPSGNTVAVMSDGHEVYYSKDGMWCNIYSKNRDNTVNIFLESIKKLSQNMSVEVGDGTTSALIAAHAIYNRISNLRKSPEGKKHITPEGYRFILDLISDYIVAEIDNPENGYTYGGNQWYEMDNNERKDLLMSVGRMAANGNEKFAEDIVNIFIDNNLNPGSKTRVTVNTATDETKILNDPGSFLACSVPDAGFKVLDIDGALELKNCRMLVVDGIMSGDVFKTLEDFIVSTLSNKEELVIVSNVAYDPAVLQFVLAFNQHGEAVLKHETMGKIFKTNPKPHITLLNVGRDPQHKDYLKDLSAYIGTRPLETNAWAPGNVMEVSEYFKTSDRDKLVPLLPKITLRQEGAYIESGLDGDTVYPELQERREKHHKFLEEKLNECMNANASDSHRRLRMIHLRNRLDLLKGSNAVIKIGGKLSTSKEFNQHVAIDVVDSCNAAMQHGVTLPGQVSIWNILSKNEDEIIDKILDAHGEERIVFFETTSNEEKSRKRRYDILIEVLDNLRHGFVTPYVSAQALYHGEPHVLVWEDYILDNTAKFESGSFEQSDGKPSFFNVTTAKSSTLQEMITLGAKKSCLSPGNIDTQMTKQIIELLLFLFSTTTIMCGTVELADYSREQFKGKEQPKK